MMAATLPPQASKAKEPLGTAELLGLVGEIGYLMAIPAVLFGFGGAYLDKTLGTSPLCVISGLALALVISTLAVWRRIKPFLNS